MDIARVISEIRRMLLASSDLTALADVSNHSNRDPFKILITTVLSHRTKDEVTSKASTRLFAMYPDVESLAKADANKVAELIKPVGFYRVKARNVRKIARILHERYDGMVPENMEDLLSLPAVGRKTANCVLVYAFQKPAIPVDTHVHRISNRLGLVHTNTAEETEKHLTGSIDKQYWLDVNDLFVRFGQSICKPIRPRCSICTLKGDCEYYRQTVALR